MASKFFANLASLVEPDAQEITDELKERFSRGVYYVKFGDGVISINPQVDTVLPQNSPQNGRKYCSKKPALNLPPHVYGLAHTVYQDVVADRRPRSILVSGVSGSGKTEVTDMLIGQFFREAGVSRSNDLPYVLMKGLSALKRLTTIRSVSGPASSVASVVITLYLGQDGSLKTARIKTHLLNARHARLLYKDCGHLNIFYDLLAGLNTGATGLSLQQTDISRILSTLDPSLAFSNKAMHHHHIDQWRDFVEAIKFLHIGQIRPDRALVRPTSDTDPFLDSLLGLLLLASVQFGADSPGSQPYVIHPEHLQIASQMLGISAQDLFYSFLTQAQQFGSAAPLPVLLSQARDQVVYELYSRLVKWLEDQINAKLPHIQEGYLPILIADLPTFDDKSSSRLDGLCQNITAESVQTFQNTSVFVREFEACRGEGLKTSQIKRHHCDDVVDLAFSAPMSLMSHIERLGPQGGLSEEDLVLTLDKTFKKSKDRSVYVASKHVEPGAFAIVHSHKQVSYKVTKFFREENNIIPNRGAQRLLADSENFVVRDVFKPAISEFTDPNARSHFSYITYTKVQLNALTEQLENTVIHLVRCIKPAAQGPVFDPYFVLPQIDAACLPEVINHKKFEFAHWMTLGDFLKRYRMLGIPMSMHVPLSPDSCRTVLDKVGILQKGACVTTNYVFLVYWHKEKLDALAHSHVWKVTRVQAQVRGHLARKRLHGIITARLRSYDQIRTYDNASHGRMRRSSGSFDNDEVAEAELYQSIIMKTLDRLDDLPSSTWAKVIYMEQGREVTKLYAAGLSLFVNGSYEPFEGLQLGLPFFRNPERTRETDYILRNLGQGIELHRDSDGSILAKRCCKLPVWVRRRRCDPFVSTDMLRSRGELALDHFMKIFDMQEFHKLISVEMKQKGTMSKSHLRRLCVTPVSFGVSDRPLMELPCWLAIVNMTALNLLDDDDELDSIALLSSQVELLKTEEEEIDRLEQEEAKQRRQRKHWSRSDQRPHLKMKEANPRKVREELRRRGEKISDHMKYSWEEQTGRGANTRMDQLYEKMIRENSLSAGPMSPGGSNSSGKQWAKVDVALRVASRELGKT